ncbi:MAG: type II toxin-antitoxin system ParD family antitoxin [Erythrobacter sp.]|nr:type II toxin-antitoxin system ParD family antitoxin [Erythrobacter sp.]
MGEMNFTFPPDLENWIATRVAEGRHADAGDYVRDLIRRDQDAASRWEEDTAKLRSAIEESEASGVSDVDPRDLIDRLISQRRVAGG